MAVLRAGVLVADEEVVLAPQGDGPEQPLGEVVRWLDRDVIEETGQVLPLVPRVADRLAHGCLGAVAAMLVIDDLSDRLHRGTGPRPS